MANKIEPTNLQKRTAENIIKQGINGGKINKKRAILEAGGSESTSNKPDLVTRSKGYIQYMDEHGFAQESIIGLLKEDLDHTPRGERLNHIKFAAQLQGMLENTLNLNVTQSEQALDVIKNLLDERKEGNE